MYVTADFARQLERELIAAKVVIDIIGEREMSKADYVRDAKQTRQHTCHWPGCTKQVPPAMWGCKQHWFRLPATLRARIWATYRPGQEEDLEVSERYFDAAKAVQDWIRAQGAPR